MSTLLLALVLTQAGVWSSHPMTASGAPPAQIAHQPPVAAAPPAPVANKHPDFGAEQWIGWGGRPSGVAARVDDAAPANTFAAPKEPAAPSEAPWLEHRPLPGFDAAAIKAPQPLPQEEDWSQPLASSPEEAPAPAATAPAVSEEVALFSPAAPAASQAPAAPAVALPEPIPTASSDGGYLSARWGMSQAEVGQLFPGAKPQDAFVMVAESEVSGERASTGFFFVDDKLVAVTVAFTDVPSTPGKYLSLFGSVRDALASKYGAPASEKEDWAGEHYKLMDRGMALMMGGLRLSSTWQSSSTGITLACSGGAMKGSVQITYASVELAPLLRKEAERRQLQGL
ncbi:MAG: hypothetical protein ACOX6T_15205 [Myxococcales bacterium]